MPERLPENEACGNDAVIGFVAVVPGGRLV
jgi:hypothetical protein